MRLVAILAIISGFAIGIFSSNLHRSATTPLPANQSVRADSSTISLLDRQPGAKKRVAEAFRNALFAQPGNTTLATTRDLLTEIEAVRHSPRSLNIIREELKLGEDAYDPALAFLVRVVEDHLNRENPESMGGESPSFEQLENRLGSWARKDPGAALEAAFQFPAENQRPALLVKAFTHAADLHPALAYERWSAIEDADLRHRLGPYLAWHVAGHEPERITEWLKAFPGASSDSVIKSAFTQWGKTAPMKAIEAAKSLTDSEKAIEALLAGWIEKDAEKAIAWAASENRALPIDALTTLARTDPESAMILSRNSATVKKGRER
ncbi:MAG: hypothetical protein AAF514_22050, partial [Verrucomicrobiota bacterium]